MPASGRKSRHEILHACDANRLTVQWLSGNFGRGLDFLKLAILQLSHAVRDPWVLLEGSRLN